MRRPIALTILISLLSASALSAADREYYELRTYQLNSAEKAAAFDAMMAAAMPVLKEAGVSPVGVFRGKRDQDGDPNWRHVLAAAGSLDTFATARSALAGDDRFLAAAQPYLSFPKNDPAYDRVSISTFVAFEGFPRLVAPSAATGGGRFYELRIYESHDERKAFLKVAMFNNGELDIFAQSKMRGVFFGSALSGPNLPNLSYMLVYDDEAEHERVWNTFRKAPEWQLMKADPKYKDTVSKITSLFLVPTAYSELR